MARRRIVMGAIGEGEDLLAVARVLRDAGLEVVLVGSGQTPEQLIRAALSEDADELVVDASESERRRLKEVFGEFGADHLRLTTLDRAGVTDSTRQDPL